MVASLLNPYIMKDIMSVGLILGLEAIDYVRKSRNIMMRIAVDVIDIMVLIFKISWCFCPAARYGAWATSHDLRPMGALHS